jgi:hypothetical protein
MRRYHCAAPNAPHHDARHSYLERARKIVLGVISQARVELLQFLVTKNHCGLPKRYVKLVCSPSNERRMRCIILIR